MQGETESTYDPFAMPISNKHALRRDQLFEGARKLIRSDPAEFEHAAETLNGLFDEQHILDGRSDGQHILDGRFDKHYIHKWKLAFAEPVGDRCLLLRLCHAVSEAVNEAARNDAIRPRGWFDFVGNAPLDNRQQAARRFILVILLGADPEANSVIEPEWCDLARLQWDDESDRVLGRCFMPWNSGQWAHGNDPTPEVLDTLENAIALLSTTLGSSDSEETQDECTNDVPTHSDDFTSVNWFGTRYTFTKGNQAQAVRVLWEEWVKDEHSLSQETIGMKIGSSNNRFQLGKTFRNTTSDGRKVQHPAWGTMIRQDSKGSYMLVNPGK